MSREQLLGDLSRRCSSTEGTFRGSDAVALGLTRDQLTALIASGVIRRVFPDTYVMTSVGSSTRQALRAALLWAGDEAMAAGRSAGDLYRLEGVAARRPEIAVPRARRLRSDEVIVHRAQDQRALMPRMINGFRTTGVEATLVALASVLDDEALEVACEDARRRGLTSIPALRAYLTRYGKKGVPGTSALRSLIEELDPLHPSRSTLEVKTRRLLVAAGITGFQREMPLVWNGRTYYYDFGFARQTAILETNGRRWHDDPADYEHDNEKWSVPGRLGFRIVFATWLKVTKHSSDLVNELETALKAL